ncbi:MAG: EamA family transporter [[Ruminococcus] faecis]|nr:EamA family transporter [Mediterraneibacter faecis]
MRMKSQKFGIMLVLISGIMWGFSGVIGQYIFLNSTMNSVQLSIIRQFVSGIILLTISVIKKDKKLFSVWKSGKRICSFLFFSLTGILGLQLTYFLAIEYSNAATGTIIQFTYIIMILVYAAIVLHNKPKSYETVAVLCAFCGIFLIATHGQLNSLAVSKESLIWGLSSAVCFTIYCLYPQKLYDDFGLINVIGWGSVLSSILLAVTTGTYRLPEVPANIILLSVAVAIIGSLFPFVLYGIGIRILGSVKASLFVTVEPVTSAVLTWLCFKTKFVLPDIVGFVLILGAIEVVSVITFRVKK